MRRVCLSAAHNFFVNIKTALSRKQELTPTKSRFQKIQDFNFAIQNITTNLTRKI